MRKSHISATGELGPGGAGASPLIEAIEQVEITSEAANHPIESAWSEVLDGGTSRGWRAATPGRQLIRLHFARPIPLRRIQLVFEETEHARTQQFVVRWSGGRAEPTLDIVRQQFNFAPSGGTVEREAYTVDLQGVRVLEIEIIPDVSGGPAVASLRELRLG